MNFGICIVSVSPVRAEPSDKSEMVTQLLFGELITILETENNWLKIKAEYDNYEGWIDFKQISKLNETDFHRLKTNFYSSDLFNLLVENNIPSTIPLASHLPELTDNKFNINNKLYSYKGEYIDISTKLSIPELAKAYINVPYLWGGKSNFGIDCSGLVQQVYKLAGIKLPRDASQQAKLGSNLSFIEETLPGDLAFFDNEEGEIIHVGIILENQKIIHAHGKVRIDLLDTSGIFNISQQKYSHKLRFLKRNSELE